MPRGDKTGPRGNGRMTGRGMGYCSNDNRSENSNRRFGFGRGNGNGFRNFFNNRFSDSSEKGNLENEIANLKEQLLSIEEKLFNKNNT